MNLKTFIMNIDFKINPMEYGIVLNSINQATVADMNITELPEDNARMRALLLPLLGIPRMSTFALASIINKCVHDMDGDTDFVNIGVWNGFSFLAGCVGNGDKKCIGCDNFSEFGGPRNEFMRRFEENRSQLHYFHDMDYVKMFDAYSGSIGFYIYDGNHSRFHQCQGLAVAEPFFAPGCIVLVDDFNAEDVVGGTNDFLAKARYKYENICTIQTAQNFHPTLWNGVSVMRRLP